MVGEHARLSPCHTIQCAAQCSTAQCSTKHTASHYACLRVRMPAGAGISSLPPPMRTSYLQQLGSYFAQLAALTTQLKSTMIATSEFNR